MIQELTLENTSKRASRIAVSALFFLTGLCFSSWASRIPAIQQSLHLSDGGLGGVLLALPIGSLISMPAAGWLVSRFGSRQVLMVTALLYAALLPTLGLVQASWQLFGCLLVFGFVGSLANISVNTQAVAVEKMYNRSIMASFHGLWSLAGFTGAAIGAAMGAGKVMPYQHFLLIMAIAWVIVISSIRHVVAHDSAPQERKAMFARPDGLLLILGIIAFCSMICEGAMFDWSGVYFKKVVLVPEGMSGVGYAAFMSTMAGFRFIADFLTTKLGRRKMLQLSGTFTAAGLLIAVCFPYFYSAIFGFLLVGAGVSAVVPLVYSGAGKSKKLSPGMALATVSTIGYLGFLMGPPLIGFVAEATSLMVSFSIIAVMGLCIAIMGSKVE